MGDQRFFSGSTLGAIALCEITRRVVQGDLFGRLAPVCHFALRAFADSRLSGEAGASPTLLKATVDLTALNGETGLPVWFYQHVASTSAGGARRNARFLFARYKGEWFPARRIVSLRADGTPQASGDAATETARAALRAYVAEDIVGRFQSGKGGQP